VEEALLEHPEVRAAALIGQPDGALGERPVVYLVMTENSNVSDAELLRVAAPRVGRDLSLLSIRRIASLPMTPTGKISKADLKKQVL
jgi:acyl-coenzyme A synthetase/AMP-(fatty) acid ligase